MMFLTLSEFFKNIGLTLGFNADIRDHGGAANEIRTWLLTPAYCLKLGMLFRFFSMK
ncbi:hypothetical protein [Metabacillus idriensis]|uniref:hypothetical protein n=1 Tax=Metabacillus idriensis TaxID=324768 RepID=UPI001CD7CF96|nr:hypothetical protein [Metabacillus idriensis]